ncbi:VOC family protein [uncultured Tateyamaria sp.]|uniref:VOC family protein n=1 Tax=uncultured Tateyamaria sp. TaxID=455651 RepID=UPI00260785CC|nr:VOC family protein [uncultured Tateyamaria sp.]
MIEELHHVQIAMPKSGYEDARNFYLNVLAFSEVEKPDELLGRGGIWLESQGVRLHLGVEDPFLPAKKAHPGFRVNSLEQTIERLDRAGVAFQTDVQLPNIKRVYIEDPFGNRIELLEVTAA